MRPVPKRNSPAPPPASRSASGGPGRGKRPMHEPIGLTGEEYKRWRRKTEETRKRETERERPGTGTDLFCIFPSARQHGPKRVQCTG